MWRNKYIEESSFAIGDVLNLIEGRLSKYPEQIQRPGRDDSTYKWICEGQSMPDEQDHFDRWIEESTSDPYYYKSIYQRYRKLLRLIGQHPADVIPGTSFLEEIEEGEVITQLGAIRKLVEWSFLVPQRTQELPEYESYVTISDFHINYRISRQVKRFLDLELLGGHPKAAI